MKKKLLAAMAVVLLAGCATGLGSNEAPRPTNFSIAQQKKIQAASHWHVAANEVAAQIRNSVNKDDVLFISLPAQQTQFAHAFREQLITALVSSGMRVSRNGDTRALVIDVDVQLVRFSPRRLQNTTAEGDFAQGYTPLHELIVTTSTNSVSQYMARRSDVFYITDTDRSLYRMDSSKTIRVTGGA